MAVLFVIHGVPNMAEVSQVYEFLNNWFKHIVYDEHKSVWLTDLLC